MFPFYHPLHTPTLTHSSNLTHVFVISHQQVRIPSRALTHPATSVDLASGISEIFFLVGRGTAFELRRRGGSWPTPELSFACPGIGEPPRLPGCWFWLFEPHIHFC